MNGEELNLSHTSPGFYVSEVQAFENTVRKGEIACNEQFLLFPQSFLPLWRMYCHFHPIPNCRPQSLLSLAESKIFHFVKG